ncbi:TetR/AcrR family transcriptional regulator [Bradyrhizobium sp. LHD-71]|uniref:TetR/AcrR family transcriptional regulator n=1 Tax=Bradyrhizobium sp. LHD-71 TaxID=3072141 RepID=UPI00280DADAE|nr:TetR/AcrR family transcriptional regulator [Bradyrhizobium sp. LHD-71]MDQ8728978.1 TetR/AcrR family transcriptional regulator [Bradyrhizobium sp. LHD-71]
MVQKRSDRPAKSEAPTAPRKRGRPRAYEPDVALARAMDVFWRDGFAATSLDTLSAATGMNRPSLYGAFGDKRDIYVKAYERYRERGRQRMADIFASDRPLREQLRQIYAVAIDMYVSGEDGPRGCFTVMTATSEAVFDPVLRELAVSGLDEMDRAFARLFKAAQAKGELAATADPALLAQLASAAIHTLAVRARVRVPRKDLEAIAAAAADLICGRPKDR